MIGLNDRLERSVWMISLAAACDDFGGSIWRLLVSFDLIEPQLR
jgi:hypothetical protein